MPATIEGYITVDVSDYADDLKIHADADDIAEIMDDNNIDMDEMMEYFDVKPDITLSSISHYIQDCMHDDLIRIVNACMNRMMADYNLTFNKLVESRREADQFKAEGKVLTGGPHVSEVRPSS